jgi:hypothetical protein
MKMKLNQWKILVPIIGLLTGSCLNMFVQEESGFAATSAKELIEQGKALPTRFEVAATVAQEQSAIRRLLLTAIPVGGNQYVKVGDFQTGYGSAAL